MGQSNKVITTNRKARHDYTIGKTYDAGMVLMGSEIKSIRENRINLRDGFIQARGTELWLLNVHISPYEKAKHFGHTDPVRPRKLLLHRKEINQIISKSRENGSTIIPLKVYLDRGYAKIEIAIAKGKKLYDKRQDVAKRDAKRQIQRALKNK